MKNVVFRYKCLQACYGRTLAEWIWDEFLFWLLSSVGSNSFAVPWVVSVLVRQRLDPSSLAALQEAPLELKGRYRLGKGQGPATKLVSAWTRKLKRQLGESKDFLESLGTCMEGGGRQKKRSSEPKRKKTDRHKQALFCMNTCFWFSLGGHWGSARS